MTAIPETAPHSALTDANLWLSHHLAELYSRAGAAFARHAPQQREEMVAEILALTVASAHRAAQRGVLWRLTPFWCVTFAQRQLRTGRRAAGTSRTDVTSPATQQRHDIRVCSLDGAIDPDEGNLRLLRETLANREAEDPAEAARRRHDFPLMLRDERLTARHLATVRFLAETHGAGHQTGLATALQITPGRVSQIKREVAAVLSDYDYEPPLGQRPARKRKKYRREIHC